MVDLVLFLSNYDSFILILLIIAILTFEVFFLAFPKEVVLIYSGVAFGTFWGGIINLIGLFFAAILGYEAGRSGRINIEKIKHQRIIQKYQNWLDRNSILSLIILRLFPFTPNDILSVTSGFSRVKRRSYLIITFFAAIPYAVIWSYFGDKKLDSVRQYYNQVFDPQTWAITFVVIILISWLLIKKGTMKEEVNDL